ncbi:MFS transporter, partial [Klebsiella pneumoniae]|nr:MFS transporter [Klebsiella pneumoniae]
RASDRFGRRPTVVAGMALTGVSSLVFAATHGVAWLVAGEILYGIAGGLIMSATPVAIRELHPRGDIAAAALATTVALAVG